MDNSKSNYTKPAVAFVVAAILLGSSITLALPLQYATAQQAVTITTSADIHGSTFFGPAIVEVRIHDPALAADQNQSEDVPVTIEAFGTQSTITPDETSGTSGILLLYLKVDEDRTTAENPVRPRSPLGGISSFYSNVIIGAGVSSGDYDPTTAVAGVNTNPNGKLQEVDVAAANIVAGSTITINYGGASKTLTYDSTPAQIFLDRTNVGPDGTLFVQVYDPDINLDPTATNIIVEQVDNELLALATDTPADQRIFTETGSNTARFEVALTSLTALPVGVESQARSLTVNDYEDFEQPSAADNNVIVAGAIEGSADTSYVVEIVRGTIQPLPMFTYSSELPIVVSDSDRNTNSRSQQAAAGALTINIDGGPDIDFNMREQGINSSNFVPAYTQDRIRLTFKQATSTTAGILQVVPGQDITITYNDLQFPGSSQITTEINHISPVLSTEQTIVGQASTLRLNMTAPSLNDDSGIIESYTVTMPPGAASGTVAFGPIDVFSLEISIAGSVPTLLSTFSVTFTETGANTGVFTANIRLGDLATAIGGGFTYSDGETIEVEVTDELSDAAVKPDTSVEVTIGLPKPITTLDRTSLPVPRSTAAPGSDGALAIPATAPNLGNAIINITVEDHSANTNNLQQEILLGSGAVAVAGPGIAEAGNFRFTLIDSDGATFTVDPVITVTSPIRETGLDTGIFTGTIEVGPGANDTPAQWIGSRLRIQYAGQDGIIGTTDDADSRTVTFMARNAILTSNTSFVATGQTLTITVTDHDANRDSEEVEQVAVSIRWTDSSGATQFALRTIDETGPNTGVFTRNIAVGSDTIGGQTFVIEPDTEVRVRYYDLTPSIPGATSWPGPSSSQVQVDLTLRSLATSGGLTLTPTEMVGPATKVTVTVVDSDLNTNPNTIQTVTDLVTVVSDRGTASRADLTIEETASNTGIFEGTITLNPSGTAGNQNSPSTDVTINVLPGDLVAVRYEDEKGAQGQRTTISRTLQVVSVDPEITLDRQSYQPGQTMVITIDDLDANRDADVEDILTLRVTSTTDLVGLTNVQAIETGPNTGMFEASVPLTSTFSTGTLQVAPGDTITIEYEDSFPSDFRARFDQTGSLTAAARSFFVTAAVGADARTDSTTPSTPGLRDLQGNVLTEIGPGQQAVISIDVTNNEGQSRPFAGIVEVRDANGFTTYLQWQTGTLQPNATANIGLSWTPDEPGEYTIRTFVVSQIAQPSALSEIVQTTVNVS